MEAQARNCLFRSQCRFERILLAVFGYFFPQKTKRQVHPKLELTTSVLVKSFLQRQNCQLASQQKNEYSDYRAQKPQNLTSARVCECNDNHSEF